MVSLHILLFVFSAICLDKDSTFRYNDLTMIIQNLLHFNESYTHENWVYKDVYVGFSRLYYILDGEGYYEENGKAIRFKKNHLYLTPVKKAFTLYENPEDKLLHTYAHIITVPPVTAFTEIEVTEGTPLADAVMLWRKYIPSGDGDLVLHTVSFLLSRLPKALTQTDRLAEKTRNMLDGIEGKIPDMNTISRQLGYTREHITRNFLSAYHTTPKKYYNQRRMDLALEKLLGGAKVKTVAEELGFSTPYAFSKAFKTHFGLSPEKYVSSLYI